MLLSNAKIIVAGFDLSGDHNMVGLVTSVAQKEDSTFDSSGSMSYAPGLKTARIEAEGFTNYGTALEEEVHVGQLGIGQTIMTVAPDITEGGVAYFGKMLEATYSPIARGRIGELAQFSLSAECSIAPFIVQGAMLASGTKNANGNGVAVQLGALPAGKKIYFAVQMIAITGGISVTIALQSDDNPGFSSPVSWGIRNPYTGQGATWEGIAGPTTDTYWRTTWSGFGAGTATLAIVAGIA